MTRIQHAALLSAFVIGMALPGSVLSAQRSIPPIEVSSGEMASVRRLRDALAPAYDRAAELPRLRSLLVSVDGRILGERYFHGATRDRRANVKSVSKSIIATLVGIAIMRGELKGTHQTLGTFFPRELRAPTDSAKRRITIGQLLGMRAGLETTSFYNYGRWVRSRNWVSAALGQPLVSEPGGEMIYSTGNSHLLSAILTKATGMSTWQYANRNFARPLGFTLTPWPRDPQGIFFGGNDMRLTTREMWRVGELYRNRGRANGRQLIPAWWIDSSFTPRTVSGWSGQQYGYGWWVRSAGGHPVSFAWGYGGQFIFIAPSLRLTVVATSDPDVRSREWGHLEAVHGLLDEIAAGVGAEIR